MYKRSRYAWTKHLDFIVLDVLAQQLAFIISYCIYNNRIQLPYAVPAYRTIGILLILLDTMFLVATENMHNVLKRGYLVEFFQTAKLCFADVAGITVILFLLKISDTYSRIIMTATFCFHCVFSWVFRILLKTYLKHKGGAFDRTMILIVDEKNVEPFFRRVQPAEKTEIVGIVLMNRDATGETICGIPVVADMSSAAMYICREWVDEVFIYPNSLSQIERRGTKPAKSSIDAIVEDDFLDLLRHPESMSLDTEAGELEMTENTALAELVQQCREMAIPVHIRLGINGLSGKNFVEKVDGFNVLTCTSNFASPFQLLVKRVMDILGGLVGSLLALIIMAIVGPKIKKLSPGPILFKQERIGRNGKHFKVYKIRSMYMDAEERKKEYLEQNRVSNGMMFKLDFDPRVIGNKILEDGKQITGIGEFIRCHSLDEFPQFFNVLKGEMSIVGTRPPTLDEWEKYQYHHRARLAFKPGVTGMWQVSGRSNITDFEEVVRLDTEYIENWSVGLDVRLILKTVRSIFTKDGAM